MPSPFRAQRALLALAASMLVLLIAAPAQAATPAQPDALNAWVTAGGNLVAMRPGPELASLLGLTAAAGTLANGYLKVDTGSAPGTGIVGETIQYHGDADRYTLTGGA